MKRTIALLLSLILTLGLFAPALASSSGVIGQLKSIVDQYIDLQDYDFDFDAEKERYVGDFGLDSALNSCKVYVFLYDDMVSCSADLSGLTVPEAYRDNMAIFLTLANNELYYAHLRMDYEQGHVYARSAVFVESVLPGTDEISTLVQSPLWALDEWGDGILKVLAGVDPHQVFSDMVSQPNTGTGF